MNSRIIAAALLVLTPLSPLIFAQDNVGSNAYIDMYFGDWHTSEAKSKGPIIEHAVLTKGNPMRPEGKGAVLRFIDSFVFASLPPGSSSTSITLSRKQQIFYFTSGTGSISAAGEVVPVSLNIAVLVPANLSFAIRNTGKGPLEAYVITEPTQVDFQPRTRLVIKDENSIPISTTQQDWSRIVKPLFTSADGLATLSRIETVTLDSLTITRPSVGTKPNSEQIWLELSGTSITFIGPFLRRQTPGMAYENPPDNLAPTSSINYSEDNAIKQLLVETDGQ